MTLSILNTIFWGLYPGFGADILARATHMNGSTDNLWTVYSLIFQLPILSFIPLGLMASGAIKKGKMKTTAYDSFMFLSVLIKLAAVMLSQKYVFPNKLLINIFGTFLAIYLPFLIRNFSPRCAVCEKYKANSFSVLMKTFGQAAMVEFIIILARVILPHVPFIGKYIDKLIHIPQFGEILFFVIMLVPLYSLINMQNESNLKNFCKNNTYAIIYAVVGLIGLITAAVASKFSSFAKKNLEAGLGEGMESVVSGPANTTGVTPDAGIDTAATVSTS